MPPPVLAPVSHDAVRAAVERIARATEAEGWRPALLAGIGRGGLVPATCLSHRLQRPLVSLDMSADVPGFGAALLPRLAGVADLLLVDDINDSGSTLRALRQALPQARAAVLLDNVRSAARADYRGERIDRATDARWFVFPWEQFAPAAAVRAEAAAGR